MAHNSQNCPRIIKLILKAVHTCHILYIINFLKVTGMLMVLSWTIDYYIAKDITHPLITSNFCIEENMQ